MDRGSASRSESVHQSQSSPVNIGQQHNGCKVQHPSQETTDEKASVEHGLESIKGQRRCHSRRSITFLHAILVVLLCPFILGSIQDTLVFGSGSHNGSVRPSKRTFFGAVGAMAVPRTQAATGASFSLQGQEENASARKRQQQATFSTGERQSGKGASDSGRSNGSASLLDGQRQQSKQPVETIQVTVVKEEGVPGQRWGHTAAFLPQSNVVLFVGGQVPAGNDSVVTSDVYAMDLSANSTQQWVQLSSKSLAPHAYAARAVTHNEDGGDERLFIVGGSTADCSPNSSSVYMWKAGKSWRDGQWTVPSFKDGVVMPPRRKGARAMQVPIQIGLSGQDTESAMAAGGTSFLLLGGTMDESTCSTNSSSAYPSVDVWTMGAGERSGRASRLAKSKATMNIRTLNLDSGMKNMSMADYSSVLLPADANQGDRMLLLGGVDSDNNFAPFNQLWVLDLTSGLWSRMDTTNSTATGLDIPLGRVGHTATRTSNGTIIVHGGYTSLTSDRSPTSDVHVLDYTVTPPTWSKMESSSDAPGRAFHTALMAGDVMVVGFGEGQDGSAAGASSDASQSSSQATSQPVHFLDTGNPSGWKWSDSVDGVIASRVQSSSSSSSSSAPAAESTAASPAPSSPQPATDGEDKGEESSQKGDTPAADAPAADAPSTDEAGTGSGVTPKQRNTAVIASVLGAAAIAASLGGLYAAHKRREARMNRDNDSLSGDRYERFSMAASPGPPVSALWLHTPMAWANNAGKGLKRKASVASEALLNRGRSTRRGRGQVMDPSSPTRSPFSVLSNYSSPEQGIGFQVLRNLPANSRMSIRRKQMAQQDAIREKLQSQEAGSGEMEQRQIVGASHLPDDFLHSILDDEEIRSRNDLRRTVGGGGGFEPVSLPVRAASIVRMPSSDSLDAASHFSYPYLNAMHRPSLADMTPSNNSPYSLAINSSPEGPVISPRRALVMQKAGVGKYSNAALTPTWSPAHGEKMADEMANVKQEQQRRSLDSLDDFDADSEAGDAAGTAVAQRDPASPSAMIAAAACINSPLFPWAPQTSWGSPMILPSRPSPALDSRHQSQRRARQSILRVTNLHDLA